MDIYVRVRPGEVHNSQCVSVSTTIDYDENGSIVGYEVLGAVGLEINGTEVSKTWLALAETVTEITKDMNIAPEGW